MLRQKNIHKATNPKLMSMAWIDHKVKNPLLPEDMPRCQTSFLRDVQMSEFLVSNICPHHKIKQNNIEKSLLACVLEQQAARLLGQRSAVVETRTPKEQRAGQKYRYHT